MTVEIIGRALRAPLASNVDQLFDLLKSETCAISSIPEDRWGKARFWHPVAGTSGKAYTFAAGVLDAIHAFDPGAFGLTAREAMYMDPQQRILLELVLQALEDASVPAGTLQKERVGVYIGASSLDNANMYLEDPASGSPYFMTGNTLSIVANRISHVFGFSGPSLTIDTACSSSLVALDQAVRALDRDEIDTAIVGGISILAHPFSFVGFSQARMLSPEGLCRAFSQEAHGYVRAEGGGAIVLRKTASAIAAVDRSHARIVATGMNSAGRTNGISLPSRESQAALLRAVYAAHDIDPADLAFIEAHGTGTKVGDPAEIWAIGTELARKRKEPLPVGSIKTNVGHSEPASGMFGLMKAILALEHDFLPASLHAEELNEDIDFDDLNVHVNRKGRVLPRGERKRLAGINSFGFGGTNAHIVISDPDPVARNTPAAPDVFMISAHSERALTQLMQDYAVQLKARTAEAGDIVAGAIGNRAPYRYRFAVGSNDPATILENIETHLSAAASELGQRGEAPAIHTNIAFAFSGNGCQWAGMALDAYHNDSMFRRRFKEVGAAFMPWFGEDISHLLESESLSETLDDTRFGQSLLFAIQVALSDTLIARHVKPMVVLGHSVGEVAAAYCAGCLSLEDAVAIVAVRSRHQHALAGEGKMAAVAISPEKAISFARENGLQAIELGAINTANSVTISGPVDEIKAYRAAARKAHIAVHILDIDYPFHHPAIDREREAFLRELPRYKPKVGNIPFISAVTGAAVCGETLDASYWWKNVRDVVRFAEASNAAMACGANLFLEISPRPILASYLTESARLFGAAVAIVPTLNRPARDDNPLPHIVAGAVAYGALPWKGSSEVMRRSWVQLPNLPFERIELRPPRTSDSLNLFDRQEGCQTFSLLGWRTDPNAASWKNHVDAHLFPDLAQHVVEGKAILPGSAFIEIAVTAARQFHESVDVEVQNLEIVRPLELHASRLRELSTILSPETGQVEIRSREYLSDDDWVTHALARVRVPIIALQGRVRRASETLETSLLVTSSEAYATAKLFGLDYGDAFQLLERARLKSNRFIEVDLRTPKAPAHPHLGYSLNPVSVDAAFHGLVALFSHLTRDGQGSPYIPVRFGSVRMGENCAEVRTAFIEIERISSRTLKARIELWNGEGELVATLDDCRFRRTSFKRHQTLETVSYHYEPVSQPLHSYDTQHLGPLAIRLRDEPISEATLLLDAAIYRACFDIARRIVTGIPGSSLDAFDASPALKCFVANCFLILQDFGLAVFDEGLWQVDGSTDLPHFDAIIVELISSFPERVAAASLVNDVYRFVMAKLDCMSAGGDISSELGFKHSEASLDHIRNHSPLARRRLEEICRIVEAYLTEAESPANIVIAEFAATSVAVTERLAAIVDRFGANLVVF
ncbi:type I polyketide synthase, partial [Shinella sp.]|uniref:type I polyketide synthase n=1 Tax=Shinella sp. TaxID=1870904 RepID=UPI00289C1DDE